MAVDRHSSRVVGVGQKPDQPVFSVRIPEGEDIVPPASLRADIRRRGSAGRVLGPFFSGQACIGGNRDWAGPVSGDAHIPAGLEFASRGHEESHALGLALGSGDPSNETGRVLVIEVPTEPLSGGDGRPVLRRDGLAHPAHPLERP